MGVKENTKWKETEAATDTQILEGLIRNLTEKQLEELTEALSDEPELAREWRRKLKRENRRLMPEKFQMEEMIREAIEKTEGRKKLFFTELLAFVDRRGLKDSRVYGEAGMDRKLWYRLRDNQNARTSKKNVIKLCIILQLDYWETYYLLSLSGYAFNPYPEISMSDYIIGLCVSNGEYRFWKIDDLLERAGEEALFGEK